MSIIRAQVRVLRQVLEWGDISKFIGKNVRLTWGRGQWELEELPQKGKKKLKHATLQNPQGLHFGGGMDEFIPENVLLDAKLAASDDYDAIKQKIELAYLVAMKRLGERLKQAVPEWISRIKWYENDVFYLHVTPEGTEPFTVQGKDFGMKVEWTKFSVYSPDSDFQQSDPHYTQYAAKSAGAARKAYQILKADPEQLKNVSWSQLSDWFRKNKIGYDTNFSVWH